MKLDTLLESPALTFPTNFGFDNESTNKKKTESILTGQKFAIKSFDGGTSTLYQLKNGYALINHSQEIPRTVYYMEYKVLPIPMLHNATAAQQVQVWSNMQERNTLGISKEIFFDHLLYSYKIVITDAEQTPDGRRFWGRRLIDALNMNLYVYYINFFEQKITRIKDDQHLQQLSKQEVPYGGNTHANRAKRFIISLKELD